MNNQENNRQLKEIHDSTKKMLFVEGNDEVQFFRRLLIKNLEITDIQIYDTGGKEKFDTELPLVIKQKNFDNIERLGIIQDSDLNTKSAFQRICNTLAKNDLDSPKNLNRFTTGSKPDIGIYLMPNNSDQGMLETLCLETVKETPNIECVNNFFECLEKRNIEINNVYKAKAQAFLATQKKIVKHVGRGAQKKVWNLNADCMTPLKEFLKQI